jgi:hypothetical protein
MKIFSKNIFRKHHYDIKMVKNSKITTTDGHSDTFRCYCGFTIIGVNNQTITLRKKLHGKKCDLSKAAVALPMRYTQTIELYK